MKTSVSIQCPTCHLFIETEGKEVHWCRATWMEGRKRFVQTEFVGTIDGEIVARGDEKHEVQAIVDALYLEHLQTTARAA